jgi:hypothetical protein
MILMGLVNVRRAALSVLALLLIAVAAPACEVPIGITDQTAHILQHAIDDLGSLSASWQNTLVTVESQLTQDVQQTIKNDITIAIQRAEGETTVNIMCIADFVRTRIRMMLIDLKSLVLKSGPGLDVPANLLYHPTLCSYSPDSVDPQAVQLNKYNTVLFYGYDFLDAGFRVFLDDNNGNATDVTGNPNAPNLTIGTNYEMVLNLGSNGVQLTPTTKDIRLVYQDPTLGPVDFMRLGVIQSWIPPCVVMTEQLSQLGATSVSGAHVANGGDSDYSGHGPQVNATIYVHIQGGGLWALAGFNASETQSDWTKSAGSKGWFQLYAPPSGTEVVQLVGDPTTAFSYVHAGNPPDDENVGGASPIKRLEFSSFEGRDGADTNQMNVVWQNPLTVRLSQPPSGSNTCDAGTSSNPGGGGGGGGPTPPPPSPSPHPPPNPCGLLTTTAGPSVPTTIVRRFVESPTSSLKYQCP